MRLRHVGWLLHFPELDGVVEAVIEAKVREPLIPSVLWNVGVPMLTAATLPVLVNPTRSIMAFTPSAVPPLSVLPFPPCLPLLHSMPVWIKILIPFISPFGPTSISLTSLGPLVRVLDATTMTVILLTPPI